MADRGWIHIAKHDVEMREALRLIMLAMPGRSALDVVDGLIGIIEKLDPEGDQQQKLERGVLRPPLLIDPIKNLLQAGRIVGLDPREMMYTALSQLGYEAKKAGWKGFITLECGHLWGGDADTMDAAQQFVDLCIATDDSAHCMLCDAQKKITGPLVPA